MKLNPDGGAASGSSGDAKVGKRACARLWTGRVRSPSPWFALLYFRVWTT